MCHDTCQDLLSLTVCQECCNEAVLKACEIVDNPSPGQARFDVLTLCGTQTMSHIDQELEDDKIII